MAFNLRQIEFFEITLGTGVSSVTVTLSTTLTDTAKTFMVFGYQNSTNAAAQMTMTGEVTNTTTLTFTVDTLGTEHLIKGYVVEGSSGIAVHHGTLVLSDPESLQQVDVSGTITDITKAFVLFSFRNTGGTYGGDDGVACWLTEDSGTENINFQRSDADNETNVAAFQVVQMDNISVTRGSSTGMGAGTGTDTVGSLAAIVQAKTMLLFSARHVTGTTTDIGEKLIRGHIPSTTSIEFNRDNTGVAIDDIRWERIEFLGTERVQEITSSFIATDASNAETIAAVNQNKAFAIA